MSAALADAFATRVHGRAATSGGGRRPATAKPSALRFVVLPRSCRRPDAPRVLSVGADCLPCGTCSIGPHSDMNFFRDCGTSIWHVSIVRCMSCRIASQPVAHASSIQGSRLEMCNHTHARSAILCCNPRSEFYLRYSVQACITLALHCIAAHDRDRGTDSMCVCGKPYASPLHA